MQRHPRLAFASLVALALIAACGASRPAADPRLSESPEAGDIPVVAARQTRARAIVTQLIDGNTLVLQLDGSEQSVSLLLIDASGAGLDQCFSEAATAFVAAVAPPGSTIEVEQDVSDADRFGRLLRYVYLADGSMLNQKLVRGGFARVAPKPPDQKYIELLREAEAEARRDGVGLWSACTTPTPAPAVAPPPPTTTATPAAAVVAAVVATQSPTSVPTAAPITPTSTPLATATPAAPTATAEPTATVAPTATAEPTAAPTATAEPTAPADPTAAPTPTATADPRTGCDPSYPTVCIPPAPPDLDCGDIPFRQFTVLPPDPHRFDGDKDGVGCES